MSDFSLIAMLRAVATDTWGRVPSTEHTISRALEASYGVPARNGVRVPDFAFRDLNVTTASAGGYLSAGRVRGYIPAPQPVSAALALGATVESVPPGGSVAVPRDTTAFSTTWQASETASITETTPVFGQIINTPKILSAFCEVSRQLLLQSNADSIIKLEFARAAGAALDAAILNGSGVSGEPTGIVNTVNVGAFTGASLNQAALRNAQADVNTATAVNPATCGYVSTPAVAELLSGRQRFTGSSTALWEGASAAGTVEGCRAVATTGCPSATAIYGDWSRLWVIQWEDGLVIEADPYTKFQQGLVGVRLLMPLDIVVSVPQAFSVATGIS